jgi:23S rRNA pseudouridine1911/1915/1917 synthase
MMRREARSSEGVGSPIRVLYEDNHLLAVLKPAGLLTQGDRTGDETALEAGKRYIRATSHRPGNVFLGLVHRIDRPVSGVLVFARTSKAASRLARSFHDRKVEKVYLAVVFGRLAKESGELEGYIERTHLRSRLASAPSAKAKAAVLSYRVIATTGELSLVEVTPRTGRHHQIRLQLSAASHPIVGDLKYRAPHALPDKSIALHAARLAFPHPVRDEVITIAAPPPDTVPWSNFRAAIARYFER